MNYPATHSKPVGQDMAPSAEPTHGLQPVESYPVLSLYVPAAHFKHTVADAAEYSPLEQFVHDMAFAWLLNVPATH